MVSVMVKQSLGAFSLIGHGSRCSVQVSQSDTWTAFFIVFFQNESYNIGKEKFQFAEVK